MNADPKNRQSRNGLLLCLLGGLPLLLAAPLCADNSRMVLCLCGPLPWLFAVGAMWSLAGDRRDQKNWNLALIGILLIDAWLVLGAVLSRQLYYQVMVFAIPLINMALLGPAWLLVLCVPLVRRRPRRSQRPSRAAAMASLTQRKKSSAMS